MADPRFPFAMNCGKDRELRLRRRLLAEAEAAEAQVTPTDMGSGVLPQAAEFKKART
jgi:hypothetical protein